MMTWLKSRIQLVKWQRFINPTQFILLENTQCYPNSAWWENCEFYPTLAHLETLVILRLKLSSLFQRIPVADVIKTIYVTSFSVFHTCCYPSTVLLCLLTLVNCINNFVLYCKNAENGHFDQHLECAAPKRRSKYTTGKDSSSTQKVKV